MKRTCRVSGSIFEVDKSDLAFYERISPRIGGETFALPPPTLCPDERQRRRLASRNERYLYRTRCAISGKSIVSAYSPDKDLKVCERPAWLELDNRQFGRDIDFSRPFFEQFAELQHDTYKAAVMQDGEMVNSEYVHSCGWLKNCYLLFDSGKSEDCMYGVFCGYSRSCFDCMYMSHCELCYESFKLDTCYNVLYSAHSKNCNFGACLYDCIGCSECLCCTGLRNKRHCFQNTYVGEARFKELWAYYFADSFARNEELQALFKAFLADMPRKALRNLNCENCLGDDLSRCQNVHHSFNCIEAKDCRYCYDITYKTNDCYDIGTFGENMQFCYELAISGGALGKSEVSNCYFSGYIFYGGYNILYSSHCHEHCKEIFGCSDLRKQEYCILNKQYSKDDYYRLVAKLIAHMRQTGEWGEFFPLSISPFGYNESVAQEFYPLPRQQALAIGATWSEYTAPMTELRTSIRAQDLPDKLDTTADPAATAIVCAAMGKPFKLTPQELAYYRNLGLALPRFHPEERHRRRLHWQQPRQLWKRACAGCSTETLTSFPAQTPLQVLCEECYLKTVQ